MWSKYITCINSNDTMQTIILYNWNALEENNNSNKSQLEGKSQSIYTSKMDFYVMKHSHASGSPFISFCRNKSQFLSTLKQGRL
jgi:hypothetical protein